MFCFHSKKLKKRGAFYFTILSINLSLFQTNHFSFFDRLSKKKKNRFFFPPFLLSDFVYKVSHEVYIYISFTELDIYIIQQLYCIQVVCEKNQNGVIALTVHIMHDFFGYLLHVLSVFLSLTSNKHTYRILGTGVSLFPSLHCEIIYIYLLIVWHLPCVFFFSIC